ncbi:MAG: Flp pilus assembly protein, pilin Flp [uncultured Sphingomonadaceae bacterium]|uniref:Flp pilus assembly protein, pilin Flp n=1 Tax=uncultured Sphingomonadaceae bacterium TaxID=169976 RepID=A0A6J4TAJ8_9SPHN|nr:MAG: Flp pilus assembly protein, pilin Flp [uncultured Sphingomonadaceae bacterium]
MFKFVRKMQKAEEGATAIEYGLIAALIAVALMASMSKLGGAVGGAYNKTSTKLDNSIT